MHYQLASMDHRLSSDVITDLSSDGYPAPVPAEHPQRRALAGLHRDAHPRCSRHRTHCHRPLLLIFGTSPPDVGEWAKPEKLLTGTFSKPTRPP